MAFPTKKTKKRMPPQLAAMASRMKQAWKTVKASGLTGVAARNKVRAMLKGATTKPTATKAKPSTPTVKRAAKRRRGSVARAAATAAVVYGSTVGQILVPWLMDVEGAYRDAAQEGTQKARTTALTLDGLTQDIRTSHTVGLMPSFRDYCSVRLMLAAGVM